MGYELQVKPAPQKLAGVFGGSTIELRELTYGQMRDAMSAADATHASEGLLGASLHVDGNPVGLEALLAVPGRFAGALRRALSECIDMHGLNDAADEDDAAPKQ